MSIVPFGALLGQRRTAETVHECRRCGRTVDAATTECPACEVDSIARYEIA